MALLPCRHLLVAFSCALLAADAARAQIPGYTLETIALDEDPRPDGGVIGNFFSAEHREVDSEGRVITYAVQADPDRQLLLLYDAGSLEVVAGSGDPAPGTGGESFTNVVYPRFGTTGVMAWLSGYTPYAYERDGVFTRANGVTSALALRGQPAPGGGSFEHIRGIYGMNAAGDVLFHAQVDLGESIVDGLYLARAGGILRVARDGDAAPVPGGGSFDGVPEFNWQWRAALSETGAVAFRSVITGGVLAEGIFVWTAVGGSVPLLLPGDPVLTPRGGSFTAFSDVLSLNAAGEVAVFADFVRPGVWFPSGVFVVGPSGHREVISRYDPLPGLPGFEFGQLWGDSPRMNAAGDVVFSAISEEGQATGWYVTRGHVLHRLEFAGQPVPDRPGVVFGNFFGDSVISDAGHLVLHTYTSSGLETGLFLATPLAPEIPLAPPVGLAALAALLLAHTRLVRPAQNGSRSTRFRIFPEPVRGSSGANESERGTL